MCVCICEEWLWKYVVLLGVEYMDVNIDGKCMY